MPLFIAMFCEVWRVLSGRSALLERGTCQKLGALHHLGERTREVGEGDSGVGIR